MKLGKIAAATLTTLLSAGAYAGFTATGDILEYFPATKRADLTPGQPLERVNHIFGLGGAAGYRWDAGYSVEADYQVAGKTVIDGGYKWASDKAMSLNGLYELGSFNKIEPFVLAGIGRDKLQDWHSGNTYSNSLLNLGVGAFYPLVDRLYLRTELRGQRSHGSGETFNDFSVLLGVQYRFGELATRTVETPPAEPVQPVVVPPVETPATPPITLDQDGDGVVDGQDKCPNTPPGAEVDLKGCPVDNDKDGVPDFRDDCPNSPAGIKVNSRGCSPDMDKDGVPDSADKCPNTPAGVKVDATGCPVAAAQPATVAQPIRQQVNILFDSGKQLIKPEFKGEVQKVADLARQYPTALIEIQGYTDNKGNAKRNVELSKRRADAVRDSLIKDFSVDASRITTKGYGPASPVADNATEEGRAKNRRVIAVLTSEAPKAAAPTTTAKPAKAKSSKAKKSAVKSSKKRHAKK